jgi:hypothetical protein
MSIKTGIAVAAAFCALVGLSGGAGAEMFAPSQTPKAAKARKPMPKVVEVHGCATQGVPQFCVLLGGFNVTAANPAVPMGQRVGLTGVENGNPSICSGITLEKIRWRPIGGKCPKPKGDR